MELQTWIVLIIELIGTVAFSVSGAMVGMRKQMDIFGVIVLGVVTAVGGGCGMCSSDRYREPLLNRFM